MPKKATVPKRAKKAPRTSSPCPLCWGRKRITFHADGCASLQGNHVGCTCVDVRDRFCEACAGTGELRDDAPARSSTALQSAIIKRTLARAERRAVDVGKFAPGLSWTKPKLPARRGRTRSHGAAGEFIGELNEAIEILKEHRSAVKRGMTDSDLTREKAIVNAKAPALMREAMSRAWEKTPRERDLRQARAASDRFRAEVTEQWEIYRPKTEKMVPTLEKLAPSLSSEQIEKARKELRSKGPANACDTIAAMLYGLPSGRSVRAGR